MVRTVGSRLALSVAAAAAAFLAVPGTASAHGIPAQQPPADATYLVAALNGRNEVPGAAGSPAAGDKDGRAVEVLRIQGNQVSFAIKWTGIGAPTAGHLHLGAAGANGPMKVLLFGAPLPATLNAVVGTVTVADASVLEALKSQPGTFYTNLHNAEFPGGALRGQLHTVTHPVDLAAVLRGGPHSAVLDSVAPVIKGEQIYACTKQANGGYAYTQHNVSARLAGGIRHSFVKDVAGPPQWIARDRSAITGKVLTRTPNGAGNIPELDLDATQSGASKGLFAGVAEIERLNTVGGVAPAGPCDPIKKPTARVPYEADYVFLVS
ncbi:CHRD domain-containing protein [Planosporangium flavigriseum]|uniref:CHRD domain-containing protein n=1 Tax=Planosporangium flavigriseum TaxID=373681 RepID=A0A8J3LTQ5_9ACTN|nr:CHRD domain-containing protein [Planosporangium flavigriseum]NJC63813.1 CHRD domain-containing protein [Planosporangium flavigriseum]GIG73689.1 hypothetical protein Pfl04_20930 [Planosporangium flavigriseum]